MMDARFVILVCFVAAGSRTGMPSEITFGFDPPSLQVEISKSETLKCCFTCKYTVRVSWQRKVMITNKTSKDFIVNNTEADKPFQGKNSLTCSKLILKDIKINDTGLYRCAILAPNDKLFYSPGTFLQVYVPIHKTLNISERSKNSIITVEGVLLLLFVMIPGIVLICKSKGLYEIERKKGKEDENIYEGLNLDDCNSTYHQIQRSLVQGPYQDVLSNDDEDIQLEKP